MKKTILLVEDNGAVAKELKEVFSEYEVVTAYSISSALDRWDENPNFDCIIVDLQINPNGLNPEENGLYTPLFGMAFINRICKDLPSDSQISLRKRMIIYSAFTKDLKQRERNFNSGQWDLKYITVLEKKAKSIAELEKKIQSILN